jgi:hypothetical protein
MAKHTPGPWFISDLDPHVVGPRRTLKHDSAKVEQLLCVARVAERLKETAPNARLIAAAPDLLAELQNLVDYRDRVGALGWQLEKFDDQLRKARELLARIAGEQP